MKNNEQWKEIVVWISLKRAAYSIGLISLVNLVGWRSESRDVATYSLAKTEDLRFLLDNFVSVGVLHPKKNIHLP